MWGGGKKKGRDKREGVTCLLADDTATWLLYVLSDDGERVAGLQKKGGGSKFQGSKLGRRHGRRFHRAVDVAVEFL